MKALRRCTGAASILGLLLICPPLRASSAQPAPPPTGAPPAERLAERLQARYDGIHDFSADFTQTYRGGVLRKTTTERGNVLIKKPGLMKWTYTSPESKLFVADGKKMYIYVPADRQVMVRGMPATDAATTPIMFLVGRGNIARDFRAEYTTVAGAPADTWSLRLTPHQKQAEYDWLALVVDPKSLAIRMLVAQDAQGGTSTFSFAGLKENVGIPDKSFSFNIPRGVDVITEG
jgi:outer membrane lipoprotein carrier protein